jgi:hypothetical protein
LRQREASRYYKSLQLYQLNFISVISGPDQGLEQTHLPSATPDLNDSRVVTRAEEKSRIVGLAEVALSCLFSMRAFS